MINVKPRLKLTYADYLTTPEDKRYELLDGELVMTPAPNEVHQRTQAELGYHLMTFVKANGLGRIYYSSTDVVLSDIDVVQPDLLFVSSERTHIITPDNIQGAPDLVVEILSPSTAERDRGYKRALYAQHGVKEYWVVGTDAGAICASPRAHLWRRQSANTVLLLGDEGYEVVDTFGEGDTLTSPTLAGFNLQVDEIFGS